MMCHEEGQESQGKAPTASHSCQNCQNPGTEAGAASPCRILGIVALTVPRKYFNKTFR
jgi:hypothetical protein